MPCRVRRLLLVSFVFLLTSALLRPATVLAAAPPSSPSPAGLPEMLVRLDELRARRDDPAARAEARRVADAALVQGPTDYGALWRAARELFDESDAPHLSEDDRSRLGQKAYDFTQRAIAANPNDAAAQYWAALTIGRYAEKMGVLRAIANGIEGKFKRPLERATALDVSYDHGSIPVVWAAYYLELPWPKRDRDKAAAELRRALTINPANLRARLYQARIAIDEDHPEVARALLATIAAAPVGRYDAPEERAVKKEAAVMAAKLR
jgi:tetratricopeptide (TPR) repeat protein